MNSKEFDARLREQINGMSAPPLDDIPQNAGSFAELADGVLAKKLATSGSPSYLGQSQSHQPLSTEFNLGREKGDWSNVLQDIGFDGGSAWKFNCRAHAFATESGKTFLSLHDSPKTVTAPSFYQDAYIGFDGRYAITFTINIRTKFPYHADRRVMLLVWQWVESQQWGLRGKSNLYKFLEDGSWIEEPLFGIESGGRWHRFEVMWFDEYPEEVCFDSAQGLVKRL